MISEGDSRGPNAGEPTMGDETDADGGGPKEGGAGGGDPGLEGGRSEGGRGDGASDEAGEDGGGAREVGPAPAEPDVARVLLGCAMAWALPGSGHAVLGRIGRGVLFGVIVLGLFIGGISLGGKVYRPRAGDPLSYVAAVGAAGVGVPYVVAQRAGLGVGDVRSATYEYGTTFTLVAGLLNLLIVLDAFDVATGRR